MEAAQRTLTRSPVNTWLRAAGLAYSAQRRAHRGLLFRHTFALTPNTRILDLGGGTGAHLRAILAGTAVEPQNICIADVSERDLAKATAHGHCTARLADSGTLPFADQEFDLVWCSSVIEHVTGDKAALWEQRDNGFSQRALAHQRAFAEEIQRVGKAFWVQTPARSFPVEQHTWLPAIHWLPRAAQVAACRFSLNYWLHGSIPDFNLLTRKQMRALFPGAQIRAERVCGLTKSWIAIRA